MTGLTFMPLAASAQSHDFAQPHQRSGSEARLSLTVPFGADTSSPKTEPRLELGVRNYRAPRLNQAAAWLLKSPELNYTESRVGLTLSETPNLMLNGEAYIFNEEQANASTAGKIGIGVGVVVVVVVAAAVIYATTGECGLGESGGPGCGT